MGIVASLQKELRMAKKSNLPPEMENHIMEIAALKERIQELETELDEARKTARKDELARKKANKKATQTSQEDNR